MGRNKKGGNKRGSKLMLIGIGLILLAGLIVIVSALTDADKARLQNELNSLEANLTNSGFDWLVNYSIDYNSINDTSKINVYEKDSNVLLASFDNISAPGWYKI